MGEALYPSLQYWIGGRSFLAKRLEISWPGVEYAVNRGEEIAKEHNYHLL
jgi:hypothetical protein